MSIPRPTRGMLVELHGGQKDGQRVQYMGQHLRVPRPPPAVIAHPTEAANPLDRPRLDAYTLRQSQPDGHWVYVLDEPPLPPACARCPFADGCTIVDGSRRCPHATGA